MPLNENVVTHADGQENQETSSKKIEQRKKKKLKYSWDSGESKEEMGVWSKRSTNPFFINV